MQDAFPLLTTLFPLPREVGKTTFTKLITGEIKPDSGYIEIGDTVVLGVYDQLGLKFDPSTESQTVMDFVVDQAQSHEAPSAGDIPAEARKLLKQFEFPRSRWNEPISVLSGGERRRLQLLSVLTKVRSSKLAVQIFHSHLTNHR
jgi:ABC transport system ATP-binding/permease protein